MCFVLTVPFALVVNSERVAVYTELYLDGSGLRQVSAEANSYFDQKTLNKWTDDVEAGDRWQIHWSSKSETKSTRTIGRNFISSRLMKPGNTDGSTIMDVVQRPLSFFTTYVWTEDVRLQYHSPTNAAEAKAGGHNLVYVVKMPGSILEASVSPASGIAQIAGNTATFKIDAARPTHTVTITSRKFRWGYLILICYVLAYGIYQGSRFIIRRVKSRPKRI